MKPYSVSWSPVLFHDALSCFMKPYSVSSSPILFYEALFPVSWSSFLFPEALSCFLKPCLVSWSYRFLPYLFIFNYSFPAFFSPSFRICFIFLSSFLSFLQNQNPFYNCVKPIFFFFQFSSIFLFFFNLLSCHIILSFSPTF